MGELAAFLGIAILVIVTPGPGHGADDPEHAARRPARRAWRRPSASSSGRRAGRVAASVGLAALLVASEPVFVALKLAGAAYLVYLGLQALRHAIRPVAPAVDRAAGSPLGPPRAFRQGLLSNLGNPKIAVFFTSLLPQFGSSFWSLLALGLLFCSLGARRGCPRTRSPSPAPATCCGDRGSGVARRAHRDGPRAPSGSGWSLDRQEGLAMVLVAADDARSAAGSRERR